MPPRRGWPVDTAGWFRRLRSWRTHTQHGSSAGNMDLETMISRLGYNIRHRFRRYRRQGWRFGALNCAIFATLVCVVNIIVLFISIFWFYGGLIFEGDCEKAQNLSTGLHFIINGMSTILLSSSNYCMQCLSAPTRAEVDRAHAQKRWLNIGVASMSNLGRISKMRALVWLLLGASSIPLHLLYNSVVYLSIAASDYEVLLVDDSFVQRPTVHDNNVNQTQVVQTIYQDIHIGNYERLSNIDCINSYAQLIQNKRRNVVLVARKDKFDAAVGSNLSVHWSAHYNADQAIDSEEPTGPYGWMCSSLPTYFSRNCTVEIERYRAAPDTWTIGTLCQSWQTCSDISKTIMKGPIEYCLSEKTEQHCRVACSHLIALIVIGLNIFKALLMFYTALGIEEQPLMTIGDAVVSFLRKEDPTTTGRIVAAMNNVSHRHKFREVSNFPPLWGGTKHRWTDSGNVFRQPRSKTFSREWLGVRYRWKDNTSKTRRTATLSSLVLGIVAVTTLLSVGLRRLQGTAGGEDISLPALIRLGFGSTDPRTMFFFRLNSLLTSTVVANVPQIYLSMMYLLYNALFTSMLHGHEWATYAYHRKALRVSGPQEGKQRSTYFLSLTYRFAIPLMVLSGTIHWLVSQSFFFVALEFYSIMPLGTFSSDKWRVACGYSPIAIICVLILMGLMLFVAIGVGYVPHKPGINIVGSRSTAISAACHPVPAHNPERGKMACEELKWGVVYTSTGNANHRAIGRCAFSSKEVGPLEIGVMYKG